MPQNAHIVASGGDYTSIIAWEAAEQSSDYGAVTVGRVDGFFNQGSSSLIISGTWTNGARLEPFDLADGFDGTQRKLCGLESTNNTRAIDFVTSTNIEIDGLEIIYSGGSGTDRCLEDSSTGTYTISNALIVTETNARVALGNFTINDSVVVSEAVSQLPFTAAITFNRSTMFGQNSSDLVSSGSSTDTVSDNTGAGLCFRVAVTQSNCASTDASATAFPNIVMADNFVSATPIASKDYRIKAGSLLDINGIGAFVQVTVGGIMVLRRRIESY